MDISPAIIDGEFAGIPIVLGIVGHRDLSKANEEKLTCALKAVFAEFDATFPKSPKILLTSLAPGADLFAAKLALEHGKNWSVRVPLPFSREVTRECVSFYMPNDPDKLDSDKQAEYDRVLNLRGLVEYFEVPRPDEFTIPIKDLEHRYVRKGKEWFHHVGDEAPTPLKKGRIGHPANPGDEYDHFNHASLANAGGYIVRHSHTLIAMWDGVTKVFCKDGTCVAGNFNEKTGTFEAPPGFEPHPNGVPDGGTADMVRFQLSGLAPRYYPWTTQEPLGFDSDRGPVIQIVTPTVRQPGGEAGKRIVRVPTSEPNHYWGEKTPETYGIRRRLMTWAADGCALCARPFGQTKVRAALDGRAGACRDWVAKRIRPQVAWTPARLLPRVVTYLAFARTPSPPSNPDKRTAWQKVKDRTLRVMSWPRLILVWIAIRLNLMPSRERDEYEQFLQICQAIEEFNVDKTGLVVGTIKKKKSNSYECQTNPTAGSPLESYYRRIDDAYYLADDLSKTWLETCRVWSVILLFIVLAISLLALHAYSHPFWYFEPGHHDHPPLALLSFLVLWPVMLVGVSVVWFFRWDTKRLDYRALAEALRVRSHWARAGIGKSVSDSYVSVVRSELVWVRRALQHLCPPPQYWAEQFDSIDSKKRVKRIEDAHTYWAQSQAKWHSGKKHEKHVWAGRFRHWALRCAFFGWLVYFGLLYFGWPPASGATTEEPVRTEKKQDAPKQTVGPRWTWLRAEDPIGLVLVVGGFSFIVSGLLIAFSERKAYEQLAQQYDRIGTVFTAGGRELIPILTPQALNGMRLRSEFDIADAAKLVSPDTIDFDRARRVLESLGQEAILENAQWLLLHRSKPFELQLGG